MGALRFRAGCVIVTPSPMTRRVEMTQAMPRRIGATMFLLLASCNGASFDGPAALLVSIPVVLIGLYLLSRVTDAISRGWGRVTGRPGDRGSDASMDSSASWGTAYGGVVDSTDTPSVGTDASDGADGADGSSDGVGGDSSSGGSSD